jgi:hypothetical protein
LVNEIVDLSERVFLWAYLVVRLLLKGIGYRNTLGTLKRKLMMIPKGLDEVFEQILHSLGPDDQQLSDMLFLIAIQDARVTNAITYSWLEDLANQDFFSSHPLCEFSDQETKERIKSAVCLLDSLSQGLLEIVQKPYQPETLYFSCRAQFFHRSARDYILNFRRQEMQNRNPKFDVNKSIIRLLLAEFKFAPAGFHELQLFGVGRSPLERHFHDSFVWMSSIHKTGYIIPSEYLESFGKALVSSYAGRKIDNDIVQYPCERSTCQCPRWGYQVLFYERIAFDASYSEISYICWIVWLGLEKCLEPEVLTSLIPQVSLPDRPNLLLTASMLGRLDIVRRLLRDGWTPNAKIGVHVGDFLSTNVPKLSTIWMVFLHWFARQALETILPQKNAGLSDNFPLISLVLEAFLQFGVQRHVTFFLRLSGPCEDLEMQFLEGARPHGLLSGYMIFLSGFVDLSNPPNRDAIVELLQKSGKSVGSIETKLGRKLLFEGYHRLTRENMQESMVIDKIVISTNSSDESSAETGWEDPERTLSAPFSVSIW